MKSTTWMDQVFNCAEVRNGGVIHRAKRDVEKYAGTAAFVDEVFNRKFRLIETSHAFVVVCNREPVTICGPVRVA
jgi:hypothetical protein